MLVLLKQFLNSLRQHNTILDVIGLAWHKEDENSHNGGNSQLNWPMWCNHDNSVHIHPMTNHHQHRTSKKLFTQQTKILLFLLLIVSLTQHNHLYLHLGTRSQNNKTQPTMSDFLFFSSWQTFTILTIHQSNLIEPQQQQYMFWA